MVDDLLVVDDVIKRLIESRIIGCMDEFSVLKSSKTAAPATPTANAKTCVATNCKPIYYRKITFMANLSLSQVPLELLHFYFIYACDSMAPKSCDYVCQ